MSRSALILLALFTCLVLSSPAVVAGGPTHGNLDCDEGISTRDNQALLREVLAQSALSQTAPCTALGVFVEIDGFGSLAWGDLDCDGEISTRDNQAELRNVLQQPALSQTAPCPVIGAAIIVGGESLPPFSEDLIAEALDAGEIDYDTSLLYRAYALDADPRLPEEYRSELPDFHAGTALFKEVEENHDTISAQTMAALEPFIVRPNDPDSIWNQIEGSSIQAAGEWRSLSIMGGAYRLWTFGQLAEADAVLEEYSADVQEIVPELDKIISEPIPDEPGFPSFDVNPDQAIDIYILNPKSANPRHYNCEGPGPYQDQACYFVMLGQTRDTVPVIGNKSSAYLMIQKGWTGAERTHLIAHEMFHLRQNAYDRTEWRNDEEWFIDSTAEWGAFRVLKQLAKNRDPVHNWLPPFFYEFDQKAMIRGGSWQYRGWIFYYFLELETHAPNIVRQIWENAEAEGQQGAAAIDDVVDFDHMFPKFASYMWNQPPHDEFKQGDEIPFKPLLFGQPSPGDQHPTEVALQGGAESRKFETPAEALALTARYWHFKFTDPAVRSGVFHNPIEEEHDHMTALIKINGTWKEEDWTDEEDISFCRDKPSENWQELVIIISNSDLYNRQPLNPDEEPYLRASAVGCNNFQGTITGHGYLNDGMFDITLNDVLFVHDPADTDPTDDIVSYVFSTSSNPVIWHASGFWPSPACEISGEMLLMQPGQIIDEYAYGSIVITRSTGVYSLFMAGHSFDPKLLTVDCANSQPYQTMWPVVQPIAWDAGTQPTVQDENGKKVLEGQSSQTGDVTGGDWSWRLEEVPPD